jgi:hypothetical protein
MQASMSNSKSQVKPETKAFAVCVRNRFYGICHYFYSPEPISKRFSLVKVKAGEYFNRKNTLSILRIEI